MSDTDCPAVPENPVFEADNAVANPPREPGPGLDEPEPGSARTAPETRNTDADGLNQSVDTQSDQGRRASIDEA